MSQVRRIYAEKRPGYDVAAQQLCSELREVLGTQAIERGQLFMLVACLQLELKS